MSRRVGNQTDDTETELAKSLQRKFQSSVPGTTTQPSPTKVKKLEWERLAIVTKEDPSPPRRMEEPSSIRQVPLSRQESYVARNNRIEEMAARLKGEEAKIKKRIAEWEKKILGIDNEIRNLEGKFDVSNTKTPEGITIAKREQLQRLLESLRKKKGDAQVTKVSIENQGKDILGRMEQEVRRVMVNNPYEGDPVFAEYKGVLCTDEELQRKKAFEDEHGSPDRAADYYIAELINRNILTKADFITVSAVEPPPDHNRNKNFTKRYATVHYQVEYVSKAGIVNNREVYVYVIQWNDGYWHVSPLAKQLQLLGGMPQ
jgi:hypothetical protein